MSVKCRFVYDIWLQYILCGCTFNNNRIPYLNMHRNQVDYKDVNNKQTLSDIQNKTRTGRKYLRKRRTDTQRRRMDGYGDFMGKWKLYDIKRAVIEINNIKLYQGAVIVCQSVYQAVVTDSRYIVALM